MTNRVTAADLPFTWAGMLDRCDAPTSLDECATMRERLVAGTAEPVPDCPVHGPWRDDQTPPDARLTAPRGQMCEWDCDGAAIEDVTYPDGSVLHYCAECAVAARAEIEYYRAHDYER